LILLQAESSSLTKVFEFKAKLRKIFGQIAWNFGRLTDRSLSFWYSKVFCFFQWTNSTGFCYLSGNASDLADDEFAIKLFQKQTWLK